MLTRSATIGLLLTSTPKRRVYYRRCNSASGGMMLRNVPDVIERSILHCHLQEGLQHCIAEASGNAAIFARSSCSLRRPRRHVTNVCLMHDTVSRTARTTAGSPDTRGSPSHHSSWPHVPAPEAAERSAPWQRFARQPVVFDVGI